MKKFRFILSAVAFVSAMGSVVASQLVTAIFAYRTVANGEGIICSITTKQCEVGQGVCTVVTNGVSVKLRTVTGGTGGHCGIQLKKLN